MERARGYADSMATAGEAPRLLCDIHGWSSEVLERLFDGFDAVLRDVDEEQLPGSSPDR